MRVQDVPHGHCITFHASRRVKFHIKDVLCIAGCYEHRSRLMTGK